MRFSFLPGSSNGPLQSPGLNASLAGTRVTFGSAVEANYLGDNDYSKFSVNEIGIATSEGDMQPSLQTSQGVFFFTFADNFMTFCQSHSLPVRGHFLVNGPNAYPSWLSTAVTNAISATSVLTNTINTIVGRYAGRIRYWNVVNEAIKPFSGDANGFQSNPFYQFLGADPKTGYIALALKLAHAADPTAKLGLNFDQCDTSQSTMAQNRVYVLNAVKALLAAGAPLSWIGLEGHLGTDFLANFVASDFTNFLNQLGALGLEVHITELDANDTVLPQFIPTRDSFVSQAIAAYVSAAAASPYLTVVQSWELSDRNSWYNNGNNLPPRGDRATHRVTLLDNDFSPKPAYFALKNALLSQLPSVRPAQMTDPFANYRNSAASGGGDLRDNSFPKIPKYKDPTTGQIDWSRYNREQDRLDYYRVSLFMNRQTNTINQLLRLLAEGSLNEQAWAQNALNIGINASGVIGCQNPSGLGPGVTLEE